ncbi:MAG: valine--tRNA ligase [Flavobacteriales bacterium]|nr:valine--tRNA ligase [Flavobacteriales bacterium]
MDIAKKYDPSQAEDKWYTYWMENGYFRSVPDEREAYTVVIPPPNVTGVLHMGHMLNNTIQDVLVRRARMLGYNACWVPGTDHASIATEAKVVRKLREEGIKKSDLSRDEFMEHAWEWTHKHGGIILEQLKKLGASCDWDRTTFTMDEDYSESVIDTFIDLFQKGKIYRGERMINWDPAAKTALSDEEVIHKEVSSKLYHVRYKVAGTQDEWLTIATTRPETILGDTAICIHPKDERYTHLHGKKAIVPLVEREVPIILDDYVDMEFGTGCLKVTPAHDVNDYDLGKKHDLEVIDIMHPDGTMSDAAQLYIGEDRFKVRKLISKDLEEKGHLIQIEDYQNKVGYSERTDVVIEPRLSLQWWVDMKAISKPARDAVIDGDVRFVPEKFVNTYRHWMDNIKDWCISRQLWWGHRIPAYYYGEGDDDFVVAKTFDEALDKAKEKSGNASLTSNDLKQEEDVLDTWFSSWLWPISVFNGFYSREEVDYYYPTNDLVTAPEIMFFWVARMIIAGYEYRGEKPFENVYYTGIVRDKQGRKMSKSLGNSPDPIELMEEYGADGVRVGMLLTSPAGNDLPFDVKLCEQGRNFANKIWNSMRLIKGWETAEQASTEMDQVAIDWMRSRLAQVIDEQEQGYADFRISEVLMSTYKLIWDDFCSWYLEMIKPPFGSPISKSTYGATLDVLEDILKMLHPFMPFLSEEVWHTIRERNGKDDALIVAPWPTPAQKDERLLKEFHRFSEVVSAVRNIRKENNLSFKEELEMSIKENEARDTSFDDLIKKLCNLSSIGTVDEKVSRAYGFLVGSNEYFIPMTGEIDIEEETTKLKEELDYTKGFLNSVQKKLANERFVSGAPEQVVANERRKEADALAKIKILEEKLDSLVN